MSSEMLWICTRLTAKWLQFAAHSSNKIHYKIIAHGKFIFKKVFRFQICHALVVVSVGSDLVRFD